MTEKVSVALIGIPEREIAHFHQVVRFSKSRQKAYELWSDSSATRADLVVAEDEASVLEQARKLMTDRSAAQLVVVSNRDSSHQCAHVIKRPLLISRTLRVLDQASAGISAARSETVSRSVAGTERKWELQRVPPVTQTEVAGPASAAQRHAVAEVAPIPNRVPDSVGADTLPFPPRKERDAASLQKNNREPAQIRTIPSAEAREPGAPERRDAAVPAQARAAEQSSAISEAVPVPQVPEESSQSSFKALVVDDSLAIRKQLEIELGAAGIAADYAETGERALEMVKDSHFDLVFLDIMMPGIDGFEVCKTLRKVPEHKKTPIIMLSGKTSPLDEVQGVLAGATTYLTKPVDHAGFQTVLGRVVKWLDDFRPGG